MNKHQTFLLYWLSMLFCEAPAEPSIRRVVFFFAFVFGMAVCGLGIAGYEISSPVQTIAITIITSASGAMGLGRIAEAIEARK